jgi:hypothetical protein
MGDSVISLFDMHRPSRKYSFQLITFIESFTFMFWMMHVERLHAPQLFGDRVRKGLLSENYNKKTY